MMSNSERILQICNYQYPHFGGIELVVQNYAQYFKDLGIEQKIICFNEDASLDGWVTHRKETTHDIVYGIETIRCGCVAKIASQSISLTLGSELRKVMDEFKPTIVFIHLPNPLMVHFLMKYRRRDFRLFVVWHSDIIKQKAVSRFFYGQTRRLIDRAEKIVASTSKLLDGSEFSDLFGTKKYVLPFVIKQQSLELRDEDKAKADELRHKYESRVVGLFIGRHVGYKGLSYLIRASKLISDDRLRILIAGEGPLSDELKALASGDDKIEFLGSLGEAEKRIYINICDIACFPSITKNESFGLALAEMMIMGKPAVTFTIEGSGVNDVNIADVTGLEAPNGDIKAFADNLERLVSDDALCESMGKAARLHILNDFSVKRFEARLKELIQPKES